MATLYLGSKTLYGYQSSLTIRRAKPGDADLIVSGINTICKEGGAFYVRDFEPDQQWQIALANPEKVLDHLLVVAIFAGELVGVGNLFPMPANSLSYHVAELGMFILPPYRYRGIGKQMLTYMLDWAGQTKLEKISLRVFASNLVAISLYQKFGFFEEGRQLRQIKLNNRYTDLIWMARFLETSTEIIN